MSITLFSHTYLQSPLTKCTKTNACFKHIRDPLNWVGTLELQLGLPVCDPDSELAMEPWWPGGTEENIEDLSSKIPFEVETDIAFRLGDAGFDVLVGDTEADRLGGEPGGVNRGVLVWDANRKPCDIPSRGTAKERSCFSKNRRTEPCIIPWNLTLLREMPTEKFIYTGSKTKIYSVIWKWHDRTSYMRNQRIPLVSRSSDREFPTSKNWLLIEEDLEGGSAASSSEQNRTIILSWQNCLVIQLWRFSTNQPQLLKESSRTMCTLDWKMVLSHACMHVAKSMGTEGSFNCHMGTNNSLKFAAKWHSFSFSQSGRKQQSGPFLINACIHQHRKKCAVR